MSERQTEAGESPSEARERLEHEADAVRERLGDRLSLLTERRRRFENVFERVRAQAKRHPVLFAAAGVGVAAGVGILWYRRRVRARRADVPYQIARAVSLLLGRGNPPPLPSPPAGPSLTKKLLARVGDALLSAAIGEISRRSAPLLAREPAERPSF
jgi:hypothetical protein